MFELPVLEVVVVGLYLVPLIAPFAKRPAPPGGLAWLPPLALVISAALFPAYGIRLECVPLLVLGLVINVKNFSALLAVIQGSWDIPGRSPRFTVAALGLLLLSGAFALMFAPRMDFDGRDLPTLDIRDAEGGREYYLRLYDGEAPEEGGPRPLAVVAPPALGSVAMVDGVCQALADRGFTVVTFSRRGFDFPAVGKAGRFVGLSLPAAFRLLQGNLWGTRFARANALGRGLEAERRRDVLFILDYLRGEDAAKNALGRRERVFLVGYQEGAAALTLLAQDPDFRDSYREVRGIVAVEGPVLSLLEPAAPLSVPPVEAGWSRPRRVWEEAKVRLLNLAPRKIRGPGPGQSLLLPAFFILSDLALDDGGKSPGNNRYETVFQSAALPAGAGAALAAVPGFGPLDYTDIPGKMPLVRAFFPAAGERRLMERGEKRETGSSLIAALTAAFAGALAGPGLSGLEALSPVSCQITVPVGK